MTPSPPLSPEALLQGLDTTFLGRRLLLFDSLPSTMTRAREEAEAGAPEGTVVVAERQTEGRGRFGRTWISPPGNLYFTAIFRPQPSQVKLLNMAAAVALARSIYKTTSLTPTLKWPNDVQLRDKKVAGILLEGAWTGEELRYALLGIGVNIHLDPVTFWEIADTATSLSREAGRCVSRVQLFQNLLAELEDLYLSLRRGQSPWEEWRALLHTLGKWVRVRWGEQLEEGLAQDVDPEGNLLLLRRDGSRVSLAAGEVTFKESG